MGLRVEDYVCLMLGLRNIKINGNYDINFDAGAFSLGTQMFYEIKSVKKSSSSIIYLWRIEKEKYAAKQNDVKVRYAFCVHSISDIKSHEVITKGFIDNPPKIYIVSLRTLLEILHGVEKTSYVSEKTSGYNRVGYSEGYKRLPIKSVINICTNRESNGVFVEPRIWTK